MFGDIRVQDIGEHCSTHCSSANAHALIRTFVTGYGKILIYFQIYPHVEKQNGDCYT